MSCFDGLSCFLFAARRQPRPARCKENEIPHHLRGRYIHVHPSSPLPEGLAAVLQMVDPQAASPKVEQAFVRNPQKMGRHFLHKTLRDRRLLGGAVYFGDGGGCSKHQQLDILELTRP
eukprot:TRINITY_DN29058_c0_g1_i2.p1 TRINITY_DN29058_c0_g1~~TRINITY_DN29058_c0_g1_i2.p1  ORF type:complete len:118 (-),score=7.49 TRINITY_DN29058_c0_g1_i2:848-1201(-)